MKQLVDTNVFLEVLLGDARSDDARVFLDNQNGHDLFVSDFALHSIGLVLLRRRLPDVFRQFLSDIGGGMCVGMISLKSLEFETVVDNSSECGLDFDDAYQYTVAEKYGLGIVSFDSDFDRTKLGRKTPSEFS